MIRLTRRVGPLVAVLTVLALTGSPSPGQSSPDEQEMLAAYRKAEALKKAGNYAEAAREYERAIPLATRAYGAEHPNTATLMNNLAEMDISLGRYAEAEPLAKRSLQIRETKLGQDHPAVAISLNLLAWLYWNTGRYAEAEPLLKRGLRSSEARLGQDHPEVATSLNNLAQLYVSMGRYAEAEPLYRRSLQIREAKLGQDHPDVANSLNNLGLLYQAMGQYTRAEPLYRRSLDIREARLGKDHPAVGTALNNLAYLYYDMREYGKAEPLFRRSLAIREKQLGKDHPDVANSLNNLAGVYYDTGAYDQAESLLRRSLQIREDKLGKDHPDVAVTLNNLGLLYCDMGQPGQAEPLLRRSLDIRVAKLGKDHPDVALNLNGLAELYASQGRWDEAAAAADRERRAVRRHVARTLPVLAESEQLTFLRHTDEKPFHVAQSLGLARRREADTVALSAGWVLNGKAVAQESLAQRALLARDRHDPATASLSQQLLAVRRELAGLTLAAPRPGQEEQRRRQLDQLAQQEQDLARRLAQAGGTGRAEPWIELADVRKALSADAVLVEVSRFDVYNFQARGQEKRWLGPHYAAWVIPPAGKGDVRLIDLGPADPIDTAVQAVRQALRAAPKALRQQGEPDSEKELRRPLEALAHQLLPPLAEALDSAKEWVVSPDASLWLVPWAALPLADGSYAVEKHTIRYVVSGRDLIAAAGRPAAGAALVLADPDYDLAPAQARAEAHGLLRGQAPSPGGDLRAVPPAAQLPAVGRLPGTAAEAEAVAPRLKDFTRAEPRVYLGRQALEAVVKAAHQPRVLVLSTHGFFLEDQQVKPDEGAGLGDRRPALTAEGRPLENPLLRCGLLLAGCNNHDQTQEGDEDGVLTGLEVVGCDLRGTELVVLSACETGLGEVHNGEGVAGLRQAFQLAGARSVLATLWQIPDRDTARLMGDFFDNLASGQAQAEALRTAQLARIKAHRERAGAAHPFFWAAFTLTGKGAD